MYAKLLTMNRISSSRWANGVTRIQSPFGPNTIPARYCSVKLNSEPTEFKAIYKLPYIVPAKVLCRLKLYQTVTVLGLTGASVVTQADLLFPLVICTVSLTMLGIMGEFFRKLIGIIYINSTCDKVKISHLNFWGNRVDAIFHIQDLIPPVDIGENLSDAYVKLTFIDKSLPTLYLSVKHGQILDRNLFGLVIGETLQ